MDKKVEREAQKKGLARYSDAAFQRIYWETVGRALEAEHILCLVARRARGLDRRLREYEEEFAERIRRKNEEDKHARKD